jgi:hypothetical protein
MRCFIFLLFLIFSLTLSKAQEVHEEDTVKPSETYEEEEQTEEDFYSDEGSQEMYEEYSEHQLLGPEELESTREYQSGKMEVREFDERKWKKIVGSADYSEKPPEVPKRQFSPDISAPWGSSVLRLIAYVVIAGVIILLLYLVFRNMSFNLKLKKTKGTHEDFEKPVENIEEIDIQALLQKAIADKNFRLAVRLYYLGLLKKLNEMGMIAWKKDKTNRDYLMELFSKDYYFDDIKQLTLSYEQVWYGERTLTTESFQKITRGFEMVQQKINTPSVQ